MIWRAEPADDRMVLLHGKRDLSELSFDGLIVCGVSPGD